MDPLQQRATMITALEAALDLANRLQEGTTAWLIERALDEARSKAFTTVPLSESRRLN